MKRYLPDWLSANRMAGAWANATPSVLARHNIHFITLSLVLGAGIIAFYLAWFGHNTPDKVAVTYTLHSPDRQWIEEAGIRLSAAKNLGHTEITVSRDPVNIGSRKSIAKIVGIHPEFDDQLDAEMVFVYEDADLDGLDEEGLVLYSSSDTGKTWTAHSNSVVDPERNTITLDGIAHFSLWTAAAAPPPPPPVTCIDAFKSTDSPAASINAGHTGLTGGLLCIGSSVNNQVNVINADTSNYASITILAGVGCSAAISVNLGGTVPAGNTVGFVFADNAGILNLGLLGNALRIKTYMGGSPVDNVQFSNGSLLNVQLLGGSGTINTAAITNSGAIDEIQFEMDGALLSLLTTMRVYYAFKGLTCPPAPGGVANHLKLWLRGENYTPGGTVTWSDISGNSNNFTQSTVGNQPAAYPADAITNFHPGVLFNGPDYLTRSSTTIFDNTNDVGGAFWGVATTTGHGDWQSLIDLNADDPSYELRPNTGPPMFWKNGANGTEINHSTISITKNQSYIYSGCWVFNGVGQNRVNANVKEVANFNFPRTVESPFMIGGYYNIVNWQGVYGELIAYNNYLTALEKQRIESYLALKYGVTLDQTTPLDYLASDGTTKMWDGTVNAAYNKDITGIGRDDNSALYQKQSRSVHDSALVTLYNGNQTGGLPASNTVNSSSFSADKSFLTFGDNGGTKKYTTSYTPNSFSPVAGYYLMNRIWKVQETGTIGTVTVRVPATSQAEHLIVHSSANFGSGTPTEIALTDDGNGNLIATVDLANGQYFTFGNEIEAPGCVAANMLTWYKASDGVTGSPVSAWQDLANGYNVIQSNAAHRPALQSTAMNFNPALLFDGGDDHLEYTAGRFISTTSPGTMYGAATNAGDGGYENLTDLGIDNPHMGKLGSQQIMWMNGSSPVQIVQPVNFPTDRSHVWGYFWNGGGPNVGSGLRLNGTEFYEPTTEATLVANSGYVDGLWTIGAYDGIETWNGLIGEIVLYDRNLATWEKDKVETYMALKYGNTLTHNYYAGNWNGSSGTTLWTTGGGYDNDIAGIGRDDCQALLQKQSQSTNPGSLVAIYLGDQSAGLPANNASNGSSFAANERFMLWGSNGGATTFGTAYSPNSFSPSAGYFRMSRIWRVKETGVVGTVTVSVPVSSQAEHLLVHNSANFNSGTPSEIPLTDDGNGHLIATVDLADGQYFTFGNEIEAPGCVAANLLTWYKASTGVTGNPVSVWQDLATGRNVIQNNAAHQPAFHNAAMNFNPALLFDGSNDHLEYTAGRFIATNASGTMYGAATNGIDGGLENLAVLGIDNPHMGVNATPGAGATAQEAFMWMNGSSPVYFYNPTKIVANRPEVYGYFWNGGGPNVGSGLRRNGAETLDPSSEATLVANSGYVDGLWTIGAYDGVEPWNGYIGEIVLYDRNLTTWEKDKVESYMAIKYGSTLTHNYYAGDWNGSIGTTLWTTGGGYDNDIAGIGRDDCQALLQKQSQSVNPGSVVAIYLGDQSAGLPADNASNSSSFAANERFMLWGSNGAGAGFGTSYSPNSFTPAAGYYRMDRIWRVKETGTVGVVTVSIPFGTGAEHLLVHSSANFNTGTPTEIALTDNGAGSLIATVDLTDGQYFTFGKEILAPGCVTSDIVLWLKANAGVSESGGGVSEWFDQSGANNNVSQATPGNRPTKETAQFNYNPALKFDSKLLVDADGVLGNLAHDGASVFIVNREISRTASRPVWQLCTPWFVGMEAPWSDGYVYFDYGRSYTQNPSGISVGSINIFNGTSQETPSRLQNIQVNHKIIRTTNALATYTGTNDAIGIGGRPNNVEKYNGHIAEVIVYTRGLSAVEVQRVNSYLALKYGITLDQTVATNYLSGGGTVIWNVSGGYNTDIAGIGRDACQGLDQRQSRSVNTGNQLAIYHGDHLAGLPAVNEANTEAFAANESFMIWGHNNGANTYTHNVAPFNLLARKWKVQETGAVGTVTVHTDDATAEYLVVDTDGDGNFNTGTPAYVQLDGNGNATYDFADGDHFTFGQVVCIESATYACSASGPLNLVAHVLGYMPGGTWTDVNGSGVDLSDPTSVDLSSLGNGAYTYSYHFDGTPICYNVLVNKVTTIPAPALDNISACEGDDVTIHVPFFNIPQQTVFHADFAGGLSYIAQGQCTGAAIGTCPTNNEAILTSAGLTLSGNFSTLYRSSDYIRRYAGELQFNDVNSEFCVQTATQVVNPGDQVTISVDLRRSYGYMEADDYVRVYSIINGVETLEAEYAGQISASMQTFLKTGINAGTVAIKVCVKNGDGQYGIGGYDGPLEQHAIGDMKIIITPQLPVYTYYNANPNPGPANVLGVGQSYDPETTVASSPQTVWVTCMVNGCESLAEPVVISVSPNSVEMMDGSIGYYCPGGPGADPTLNLNGMVINYQPGGSWNDDDATGVSLANPAAVDFTGVPDGVYHFTYTVPGAPPCNGESATIIVSIGDKADNPILDDITTCEGGSTVIYMPIPEAGLETLFHADFDGATDYVAHGECTGSGIGTCPDNNLSIISSENLTLSGDFSALKRSSDYIRRINGELIFHDVNSAFCLQTPVQNLSPGDEAAISVVLRRSGGYMEADDYIRVYSIINGVEMLEQEYAGQISAIPQTFIKTGITGATVALKVCVKNGDGVSGIGGVDGPLEQFGISDMKIIKTPELPTCTFYDADPEAGPANVLATAFSYDPGTTAATSPETVWVQITQNGCESDAVPVVVTVNPNPLQMMDGSIANYCPGGPGANPVIDLQDLVYNHQPGGVWNDNDGAGVSLASPTAVDFTGVPAGTYHFTYAIAGTPPCPGEAVTIIVAIGEMTEDVPTLSGTTAANTCPATTANISSLVTSPTPSGATLVWSTDGDPGDGLSSTVADPTAVSTSGTYFAYYQSNGCYGDPSVAVTVTVTVCNNEPEISNNGSAPTNAANFLENGTGTVVDYNATDLDGDTENGGGLVWSINGGADAALFSINQMGELTFNSAPDFENPTDADLNNTYIVEVKVTDSYGEMDVQTLTISVTNDNTEDADGDGVTEATDPDDTDPCVPDPNNLACPTGDFDGDGDTNGDETTNGTDPTNPCSASNPNNLACATGDFDGDGDTNGDETTNGTDPTDPCEASNPNNLACPTGDFDGDGDTNGDETTNGTDPSNPCSASNPNNLACATGDFDGDGDTNGDETTNGTDPTDPCDASNPDNLACPTGDFDGDGDTNGDETTNGTDPTDPCDASNPNNLSCPTGDFDGDGTPNGTDSQPTNPCIPNPNALACPTGDFDGDGVTNGTDPDPSDPCIPNPNALACPTGDFDNDGTLNGTDPQPSNPCVPNPNVLACPTGDFDGDGLTNTQEASLGTDPTDSDTDNDGRTDFQEVGPDGVYNLGTDTNPKDADTDNDGISDGDEVNAIGPLALFGTPTNPLVADSDGDGINDGIEAGVTGPILGGTSNNGTPYNGTPLSFVGDADPSTTTNPANDDTDGDGLTDGEEDTNHNGQVNNTGISGTGNTSSGETDPNDSDTDNDGVTDGAEASTYNTNPLDTDTDNDGITDGEETDGDNFNDGDPLDPCDPNPNSAYCPTGDTDLDGVPNSVEITDGTNPNDPADFKDTDGDLVPDYVETQNGSNPNNGTDYADADGDLVPDYVETIYQPNNGSIATNPNGANDFVDTDNGGVPDYVETILFPNAGLPATNPNNIGDDDQDTDNDGVPDYQELQDGTNPMNPASYQDTDGDLVPDYVETQDGTDPNIPTLYADADGDLVPDYVETTYQPNNGGVATNPNDPNDFTDTDNGGVPDYVEAILFPNEGLTATNPLVTADDNQDTDNDGVPDYQELQDSTDPTNPASFQDTDGDLVPDYVETQDGTNPNDGTDYEDTDGDLVPDYVETTYQPNNGGVATNATDPNDFTDTDNGGVPDYVETVLFPITGVPATDPNVTADDNQDNDNDGVPDYQELLDSTNPNDPADYKDTDGDLVPDFVETQDGTNPNDALDYEDTDGDLVPDYVETTYQPNNGGVATNATDPNDFTDTDNGGVPDYVETILFPNSSLPATNPAVTADDDQDSDGDGVPDYQELLDNTNPNDPADYKDTDGDLVPDYVETQDGTNPNDGTDYEDTDGDLVPDYVETTYQPNNGGVATNATDPNDFTDTDNGGVPDYVETILFPNSSLPATNPAVTADDDQDTDGDGVPDYQELLDNTNPNDPADYKDTDGDLVPDFVETQDGTNPNDGTDYEDTDGDLVPDYVETTFQPNNGGVATNATDPNDFTDTDNGGVPDYVETVLFPNSSLPATDPNVPADDDQDSDNDGVPDYQELLDNTNPNDPADYKDTDGDLVPDYVETQDGTNVNDPLDYVDADGDLVPDYVETTHQPNNGGVATNATDPNDFTDTDNGGVPDYVETILFPNSGLTATNPAVAADDDQDTDGDGVPDYQELLDNTSPTDPADYKDTDGDLVPDYVETQDGTNPNDPTDYDDADGDLVPDYVETTYQPNNGGVATNANDPNDFTDTDNGGVPDYVETLLYPHVGLPVSNPAVAADDDRDTDGDGDTDYDELVNGTNPLDPCSASNPNNPACSAGDTDGDGLSNAQESILGTDPTDTDTDNDGLTDLQEVGIDGVFNAGTDTNPKDADTDNDGISDGDEVNSTGPLGPFAGSTNPLSADSDGDGINDGIEAGVTMAIPGGNSNNGTPFTGTTTPFTGDADPSTTTDPTNDDTDGDGINDGVEDANQNGQVNNTGISGTGTTSSGETDPNLADTDGDGLTDQQETVVYNTNPLDTDTDNDGITDGEETDGDTIDDGNPLDPCSPNPNNLACPTGDFDGDGVLNGSDPAPTDPCVPNANALACPTGDTDGDGVPNGVETTDGTNPGNPASYADADGDLVPDFVETQDGTNPNDALDYEDTDGDLVPDYVETTYQPNNGGVATNATDPNDFTDTDNGGVPDYVETILFPKEGLTATDPNVAADDNQDTDGDGVPDFQELQDGTDPNDPASYTDSDGDLVPDYVETQDGTNPNDGADYEDTDGDLVPDYVETTYQPNNGGVATNANDPNDFTDTDNGGVPDYVETILFPNEGLTATDPNVAADDNQDTDGDGVPDFQELQDGTDPNDPASYTDSDGDLVPDYVETQDGTNPNDGTDYEDTDGDLVPDYVETTYQPNNGGVATNANDPNDFTDTDNGGVPDYVETILFPNSGLTATDPNVAADDNQDTDDDGVPDYQELLDGTNPSDPASYTDTDGDLVPDFVETQDGTNPNDALDYEDTDGDLVPDYVETTYQPNNGGVATNATDPNDFTDTDNGGVPDYVETVLFPNSGLTATDPNVAADDNQDTDGDGVPDYQELLDGTNPADPASYTDTDGDLVPDYVETQDGTNPNDALDYEDTDGDLVPDYVETTYQPNNGGVATNATDPNDFTDTDNGGVPDYVETILFPNSGLTATDPNVAADDNQDTDDDGVPDYQELLDGTNPNDPASYTDSDGDLVPDFVETQDGTNPNDALDYEDTDGDLVPDYVETTYQPNNGGVATNATDPNDFTDTDNGGVPDYVETVLYPNLGMPATDPNNAADDDNNNDGDLLTDYEELVGGSDLNDPCDPNPCDAAITGKVFMGGAYNDALGLMHDSLRVKNLIPLAQPYNTLTDYNYNGTETVNPSVFATTGPDAIVDWVFVELRDQADPTISLYKRAGLVQRDGDIVDVDGTSPLTFTGAGSSNYFVSVRHRNHLGVMTQAPVTFGVVPPTVDFTVAATSNYQLSGPTGSAAAQKVWPSTKRTLWPGNMSNQQILPDPHTGDRIIYQGPGADVEAAYFVVLLDPANTNITPVHIVDPIYSRADANMDGKVIYQGGNADTDVPFFTVFLFPDNPTTLPIFKVFEQIPK